MRGKETIGICFTEKINNKERAKFLQGESIVNRYRLAKPAIAVLLIMMLCVFSLALAQSSEEAAGQAAERAGKLREGLTHYVAALQSVPEGSADDQRLREAIIKLVQKLSPPPAIPEDARRFSVRGQTWIKEAKNPSDFEEAAKEFAKAVRVAPWWADWYINQGVALEKAGKFSDAIRSLKLYLLAAPAASDADKVKEQIYALEVRQEKAGKEAAQQQQAAVEKRNRWLQQLPGRWLRVKNGGICRQTFHYQLTLSGSAIVLKLVSFDVTKVGGARGHTCGSDYFPGTVWEVQGSVDDRREITGSLTSVIPIYRMAQWPPFRACSSKGNVTLQSPVTGNISEDGRTAVIKFSQESIDTLGRCEPTGQYEMKEFSFQRE